jgi:hypothetical protein
MSRVTTTIVGVLAIVFVLYWMSEATSSGAPWIFNLFGAVMIIAIAISVIRTWIRG